MSFRQLALESWKVIQKNKWLLVLGALSSLLVFGPQIISPYLTISEINSFYDEYTILFYYYLDSTYLEAIDVWLTRGVEHFQFFYLFILAGLISKPFLVEGFRVQRNSNHKNEVNFFRNIKLIIRSFWCFLFSFGMGFILYSLIESYYYVLSNYPGFNESNPFKLILVIFGIILVSLYCVFEVVYISKVITGKGILYCIRDSVSTIKQNPGFWIVNFLFGLGLSLTLSVFIFFINSLFFDFWKNIIRNNFNETILNLFFVIIFVPVLLMISSIIVSMLQGMRVFAFLNFNRKKNKKEIHVPIPEIS